MKNLEYEGSLKEDIEILGKEKFDLSKRIMRRIIAYLIVIALIIGFCRLANIPFFPMNFVIYTAINGGLSYFDLKKQISKFNHRYEEAINNIDQLVSDLRCKEYIHTKIKQFQNAEISEPIKSSIIKNQNNEIERTKCSDTNICFLDNGNNLQALKEMRKSITINGETTKEKRVMLFEEDDLEEIYEDVEIRLHLRKK